MPKVGRKPSDDEAPKCACGCGEQVAWQRGHGWSTFRPGHQSRCQTKFMPEGEAPFCACGCGGRVEQSKKRGRNKGWNKWIRGHHIRVSNPMKTVEAQQKVSRALTGREAPWVTRDRKGKPQPKSVRYGEENGNWKGGRIIDDQGYIRLRIAGKYVAEHRYVMEKALGRELSPDEVIHHLNGDRTDNRFVNLEVTNQAAHAAWHNKSIKRKAPTSDPPFCACGCGLPVEESKRRRGTWNTWLKGHSTHSTKRV